jgi:hypothetical protein
MYQKSFKKVIEMFLNGDFGNLKMVKGDVNKMTVKFVVKSSNENDLDKNIEIVYFDGTFKAKILGGINYTILVFAALTKTVIFATTWINNFF